MVIDPSGTLIDAARRHDQGKGWQWEQSPGRDPAHPWRVVVALAWARLLVRSLGAAPAAPAVAAVQARTGPRPTPTHPRHRLFHGGLGRIRARRSGPVHGPRPVSQSVLPRTARRESVGVRVPGELSGQPTASGVP